MNRNIITPNAYGRFSIPSVAAIGVVVASLILSFGLFTFYELRSQTLRDGILDEQTEKADEISDELETQLLTSSQLAETTASLLTPPQTDPVQLEILLRQLIASSSAEYVYGLGVWYEPYLVDQNTEYFSPYISRGTTQDGRIDPQGKINLYWGDPEYNYFELYWYQAGKNAEGAVVFTQPYYEVADSTVYMSIAKAIYDVPNGLAGVVTVDLSLPLIRDQILALNVQPEEEIYLLTADGHVFVHPEEEALLAFVRQQGREPASLLDLNREDVLAYEASLQRSSQHLLEYPIELPGWQLNISTEEEYLFARVDELQSQVLLGGAGLWALAGLILFVLYRVNRQLQTQAQERSRLATELQASAQAQASLEQMNHLLEEKVQERTAELRLAKDQAEEANRTKSAFLASMSHELRTPLNAVINFSKFVANGVMGPVNEKQGAALQKVIHSGKHLLSLINDVLDMSKIESGSLALFLEEEIDLRAILQTAASTAEALLDEKPEVKLIVELPESLPSLKADRQRILQVVLNLLSNACKFTEQGSITLRAQLIDDEAGPTVQILVKDTGPGIAPSDHQKVFIAFQQTEAGLAHGGGTGLGLPISKWLAEAHGGRIWLESEPGQGAAFYFTLPVVAVTTQAPLATQTFDSEVVLGVPA